MSLHNSTNEDMDVVAMPPKESMRVIDLYFRIHCDVKLSLIAQTDIMESKRKERSRIECASIRDRSKALIESATETTAYKLVGQRVFRQSMFT